MESPSPNELSTAAKELKTYANEKVKQVVKKTDEAMVASSTFVKEHPYYTVAGAAAVGFVAGILLRRNKH